MANALSAFTALDWAALGLIGVTTLGFAGSGPRARRFRFLYALAFLLALGFVIGTLAWFYRPSAWGPILRDLAGEEPRGALAIVGAALLGPMIGRRIRRLYGGPGAAALLAAFALAGAGGEAAFAAEAPAFLPIVAAGAGAPEQRKAALRALAQSNQIVFARREGTIAPVCRCAPKLDVEEVPARLADLLIATEDRRFMDHYGVDPIGIARAAFRLVTFRSVEGGSSLTQQLVKNALLSPERSLARKGEEAALAQELETAMSKREIVAAYLNQASFGALRGREIVGAKQAALVFYGREISELTPGEFAGLVAVLRGSTLYSPLRNPARFEKRRQLVLDLAARAGVATPVEIAAARRPPRPRGARVAAWPETRWAVEATLAELARRAPGFAPTPGARIAIPFVADRQVALERAVAAARLAPGLEVAAVALGLDGRIIAVQGGRDYGATQFNRAVTMRRPAASTAKIFVYAAALAAGRRVDGETLRRFAESHNDFAVDLARRLGVERVEAAARALGVTQPFAIRDAQNVALGANSVGLMEMTGALLPFATEGAAPSSYAAFALRDAQGALWRRAAHAATTLSSGTVAGMRRLLRMVVAAGTAEDAIRRLDFAAGKTGTGEDNRDGWFVGYTQAHVIGVWLGRDDNAPHPDLTGAQAASLFDAIGAALAAQSGAPALARAPAKAGRDDNVTRIARTPPRQAGPARDRRLSSSKR